MPHGGRRLDGDEGVLGGLHGDGNKRIEPTMTWTFKQYFLCGLILYQKEGRVKFNKGIIV
jgi:hypothetical protein